MRSVGNATVMVLDQCRENYFSEWDHSLAFKNTLLWMLSSPSLPQKGSPSHLEGVWCSGPRRLGWRDGWLLGSGVEGLSRTPFPCVLFWPDVRHWIFLKCYISLSNFPVWQEIFLLIKWVTQTEIPDMSKLLLLGQWKGPTFASKYNQKSYGFAFVFP